RLDSLRAAIDIAGGRNLAADPATTQLLHQLLDRAARHELNDDEAHEEDPAEGRDQHDHATRAGGDHRAAPTPAKGSTPASTPTSAPTAPPAPALTLDASPPSASFAHQVFSNQASAA